MQLHSVLGTVFVVSQGGNLNVNPGLLKCVFSLKQLFQRLLGKARTHLCFLEKSELRPFESHIVNVTPQS